jgi:predicted nucleotidyltransferase
MAVRLDEAIASAEKAAGILKRHAEVVGAFVFGSHVEGAPHEYSDIDLAVFVEGAEDWDFRRRAQVAVSVEREAGNNLELHIFSGTAFRKSEPASFATYVKKHGVKLDV